METLTGQLRYQRSRFSTRLPLDYRYTAAHSWLSPQPDGVWRVGYTKFATRMLGDLVETGMEVKMGSTVEIGQIIGWIECLKAASDVYCVAQGTLVGANANLEANPEWLQKDPYGKGWLYEVKGDPEPNAMDAQNYAKLLDDTIDKMVGA